MTSPDLGAVTLERGAHRDRSEGVCAAELVAWIAGETHTDRPQCMSPILGAFLRRWNDDLDDPGRQRLTPLLPRCVGTAADGHDEIRGWLCADWLIRVHTPAWLELAAITDSAAALRSLPPLKDPPSLRVGRRGGRRAGRRVGRRAGRRAGRAGADGRRSAGVCAGAAGTPHRPGRDVSADARRMRRSTRSRPDGDGF